jgi:hypothetical protein
MASAPHRSRGGGPANGRRQIAIEALVIGAVIGGVWCRWWAVQNAVPDVVIPVRATQALSGFDVVEHAFVRGTAPDDRYLGVADIDPIVDAIYPRPGTHVVSEAQREAAVRDNAALIAAVHASLASPWQTPPPAYYHGLRDTARLLCLAGSLRAAHGDPGGAARIWLDGMEVGADKAGFTAGGAIESIDRMPLWAAVNSLGSADARAAALRVERINDQRMLLAPELADEKASVGMDLQARMRSQSLLQFEGQVDPTGASGFAPRSERSPMTRFVVDEQLMMKSKSAVLHDYLAYMDVAIARASLPYAPERPALDHPVDPINQSIVPAVDDRVRLQAARRTQEALLSAALALRAYRVEHGAYPASLNALVARGYLIHAPADGFDAAGAPVRYRVLNGDRYLLYSVGPDGKDDGGRPIASPQATVGVPDGDVVAGVNLY